MTMIQFIKTTMLLILSTSVAISLANFLPVSNIRSAEGREEADTTWHTDGLVYGAKSCGGPGKFLYVHLEGCTTTNSICQLYANNQTAHGFVEFIPSKNITDLGLRTLLSEDGGAFIEVLDMKVTGAEIVAGKEARVGCDFTVGEEFRGKVLTFQDKLYNVEDGEVEICIESEYQVV